MERASLGRDARPREARARAARVARRGVAGALLLAAVVLAARLVLPREMRFAIRVNELVRESDRFVGRMIDVEGTIVDDSLRLGTSRCEHLFVLEGDGDGVPVRLRGCELPEGLRPDDLIAEVRRVVVHGSWNGARIDAERVTAMCWSKYAADVLYMRSCYERLGIPWEEARASVLAARAQSAAR